MAISNQIMLVVDGQAFGGWKEMRVQRSIEQMAGAFVLQVSHKWVGQDDPYELREGQRCQVLIGQDVVITGYIDDYEVAYAAESSTVTIHGRDKTADLVDCSAIYKSGQWHNVRLLQIVQDIVEPFGIAVVVDETVEPGEAFKSFALEEGETAFCAIDRACRMRAVLCTSTPAGDVILTRASEKSSGVQLYEGTNIKAASARHSWRERYSEITVKGQSSGDDDEHGATVAHGKASITDAELERRRRYRPIVVIAEHGAGLKALEDRAEWERNVRMGRGKRGRIDVVGWRVGGDGLAGRLWMPNTQVFVNSPRLKLDREVLIVGVEYQIDERNGRTTTLTFCLPEAFEVIGSARRSKLSQRIDGRTLRDKHKKRNGADEIWRLPAQAGGA